MKSLALEIATDLKRERRFWRIACGALAVVAVVEFVMIAF